MHEETDIGAPGGTLMTTVDVEQFWLLEVGVAG